MLKFERDRLSSFVGNALTAQVTYHRERQNLLSQYQRSRFKPNLDKALVTIPANLNNSIMSLLIARSDAITDDKTLAFLTAVEQIAEIVENEGAEIPAPEPFEPQVPLSTTKKNIKKEKSVKIGEEEKEALPFSSSGSFGTE